MYAVIKTGGKQYRVAQGDVLRVEKLDAEAGDVVTFDQVLMIGGEGEALVGAPAVDGAAVTANVLDERKDKKVIIFKKRRRQNYRRKRGHRQWITVISIAEILKPGTKSALGAKSKAAKPAAKPETADAAPAKPAKAPAKAKAEAKTDAKPKAKAAGGDDLTKLNGVGPAYAKKLAEAGVTTFAQVAAWSEADLERLDGEIAGLKAKAESGGWIAQAKELAGQ
ncbi:50S ribosomal protein L21 [Alkalicaulis satelles]|uniref:Large ribosomal subunit protein bL21 n=1 Tax=Alkalicaulis satelles TaxID=2609175 RepID=A0A5M6ZIJ4_9PROT|nr:50S ribosomal protein L21 [Alkalicaulis satelles]KAA5803594.1 50S ribosomal protein L21 [Alkalicaulis satelles]